MGKRVTYLMSGPAHMPYLVVSLWTLRQYWQGEVVISAWENSIELVEKVAKDKRLGITDVRKREPETTERNASCINHSLSKIKMIQSMAGETDVVLYLDADITVHGSVDQLLEHGHEYGFAVTQWNDWWTTGSKMSKRIARMRDYPKIDQEKVEYLLVNKRPAINSGVFAARPESPVFDTYYDWTMEARKVFIGDEIALQVAVPLFVDKGQMCVLEGGRWNCSAMYQPDSLKDEDVVIYHYHGDSNVRPSKSERGYRLWWPLYQECLKGNVGDMTQWKDEANNRWISQLKKCESIMCG